MKPWTQITPKPDDERIKEVRDAFAPVSDKPNHSYERAYAAYLPKTASAVLEIGLANYPPDKTGGALHTSLYGWQTLYPNAMIYGGDSLTDKMVSHIPNIKTYIVDQGSQASLIDFAKTLGDIQFEVIVDDASHAYGNSMRMFEVLMPKLAQNGVYFIEDVARTPQLGDGWQQTVGEWETYLSYTHYKYEIIDTRPDVAGDRDSVIVVVWKI